MKEEEFLLAIIFFPSGFCFSPISLAGLSFPQDCRLHRDGRGLHPQPHYLPNTLAGTPQALSRSLYKGWIFCVPHF